MTIQEGGSRGLAVRPPSSGPTGLRHPLNGFLMAAKAACLAPVTPPPGGLGPLDSQQKKCELKPKGDPVELRLLRGAETPGTLQVP
jgi:hypothetical protein